MSKARLITYGLNKRFFIPTALKENDTLKEMVYAYGEPTITNFSRYLYVVNTVTFASTKYKEDYEKEGARIYAHSMDSMLGGYKNKQRIFQNLSDWGILELHKNYSTITNTSRSYKLNPDFNKTPISGVTISAKESPLVKKLEARKLQELSDDKLAKHQYDMLQNHVTITSEGLKFIKGKYKCPYMDAIVDAYKKPDADITEAIEKVKVLREDVMFFKFLICDFFVPIRPNPKSRLFTNLCFLNTDYRKYLMIDGKPIMQTDLVNSQIIFSIPVIKKALKNKDSKDFAQYSQLAQKGLTYETVAEKAKIQIDADNRSWFKKRFYKHKYFCRETECKRKIKTAFNELFPDTAKAIALIKKDDYRQFPIQMQIAEATVMLGVLKQMIKMGINAMSIHDSIVVNNKSDLKLAESLIRKELAALDLIAEFKNN